MHDWKAGDRAMVEVEITEVDKDDVLLPIRATANGRCIGWLPLDSIRPLAPYSDWREKWEEETWGGGKLLHVEERYGRAIGWAEYGDGVISTSTALIPKTQPAPEPKYRPWKPEEARGKWVKLKRSGDEFLVTTIRCGMIGTPYGFYTPEELMEKAEQLDGSVCGVKEDCGCAE